METRVPTPGLPAPGQRRIEATNIPRHTKRSWKFAAAMAHSGYKCTATKRKHIQIYCDRKKDHTNIS